MDLLLVVTGREQLDRAQVRDLVAGLARRDFPGARMSHILRHWGAKTRCCKQSLLRGADLSFPALFGLETLLWFAAVWFKWGAVTVTQHSAAYIKETVCLADNRTEPNCGAVIKAVEFVQHEWKRKALDRACIEHMLQFTQTSAQHMEAASVSPHPYLLKTDPWQHLNQTVTMHYIYYGFLFFTTKAASTLPPFFIVFCNKGCKGYVSQVGEE